MRGPSRQRNRFGTRASTAAASDPIPDSLAEKLDHVAFPFVAVRQRVECPISFGRDPPIAVIAASRSVDTRRLFRRTRLRGVCRFDRPSRPVPLWKLTSRDAPLLGLFPL